MERRCRQITPLLVRYVHGTLRADQRAAVLAHVRVCAECRAALAREERLAAELRGELRGVVGARQRQLARMWAGIWGEVGAGRARLRWPAGAVLPGLSLAIALVLALTLALAWDAGAEMRVEAALGQAHPVSTTVPGMGLAETAEAPGQSAETAAVALTPAPMPQPTVSPQPERSGAHWQ